MEIDESDYQESEKSVSDVDDDVSESDQLMMYQRVENLRKLTFRKT